MIERLKQQFKTAKAKRELVESNLATAYKYTMPSISPAKYPGTPTDNEDVYESTASHAVRTLTSNLLTFLIPHNTRWAQIDVLDSVRSQVPGDQIVQLAHENDRLWELINDSNFYIAAGESMRDVVIAGVACMSVELNAARNGLNYIAVPIRQLYILENGCGEIDTVFRRHHLPARVVVQRYRVPEEVRRTAERNPDELVCIVEAMTPAEPGKYDFTTLLEKDFHQLDQLTLDYKPYTVFRWDKSVGDVWADSPVRQALPEILSLNQMKQAWMETAEYAAKGAWYTDDPTWAGKRIKPGSVNIGDALHPVPFPGNRAIADNDINMQREAVRSMLFADQLPPAGQVKGVVATAINALQAQFIRSITPNALRIENEFMREIIRNTVHLAGRNKLMREINVHGQPLEVVAISAVKKAQEMQRVNDLLQQVKEIAQLGPTAMSHIDDGKLTEYLLNIMDFPQDLMRSPQQVAAMQAAAAQQAQQQGQGQGNGQQPAVSPDQAQQMTQNLMQILQQQGGVQAPPPQ